MNVEKLISKVQCWPNNDQMLLLKAALNNDNSAIEAWEKWSSKVNIEDTDNGSYRLYPLVYRNLTDLNIDPNLIPKTIKGVYRYYWSYSNRLFFKTNQVLKTLIDNKIPVLLLKGAPLAICFYNNIATRPLNDIDIMIPHKFLNQTINILSENGFNPLTLLNENTFKFRHAIGFKNNEGFEIDLHLSLILENLNEEDQQSYWENSKAMNFMDLEVSTLCPSDHLFHTIIHGVKHNNLAPIRWITDAKMIITKNNIDWARIVFLSSKNKMSIKVLTSLKYLKQNFINDIPEEIFDELIKIPSTRLEQIEFIEKTKKSNRVKIYWFNYLRIKQSSKSMSSLSFISYLKTSFGLKSILDIPVYAFKKIIAKK
jgi:hypothetical protein